MSEHLNLGLGKWTKNSACCYLVLKTQIVGKRQMSTSFLHLFHYGKECYFSVFYHYVIHHNLGNLNYIILNFTRRLQRYAMNSLLGLRNKTLQFLFLFICNSHPFILPLCFISMHSEIIQ